ncbi:hypothetical protein B0H15DRAFT_855382 [Mycena belliarum]|uniref:Uncharacterized protein n=1 Tax=Mycena belliarum TaxID=1033014 RepID=A0AAD6XN07_9AGAR|nr:hypothetical protein B0H15DRAFT_855382 [Mycena belliae]
MPILLSRQEQASSAPNAGITFAATFGGMLILGVVVLVAFLFLGKRWRERKLDAHGRRDDVLFNVLPSDEPDEIHEKQPSASGGSELNPRRGPSMPRLTIPPSPTILRSAFQDPGPGSAVSSACMHSSVSAHDGWSASTAPLIHAHPYATASSHVDAHPYGLQMNAAPTPARPQITAAPPSARAHKSLRPFAGDVPDKLDTVMELPTPFIFTFNRDDLRPASDYSGRPTFPETPTTATTASPSLDLFPIPPSSPPRPPQPLQIMKKHAAGA